MSLNQKCQSGNRGIKCSIKGKFNIQNIGYENAASSVRFVLSDDGAYDEGDTVLKVFPYPPLSFGSMEMKTGKLKPGKSKIKQMRYNLPRGLDSSGKYIIAVIDADNAIAEVNEGNNAIVYGPLSINQ
jgi:hypothetical protein